jgi:4-hydroxy-tetrahydrodipicolinate reductase
MKKIAVCGIAGRMGRAITQILLDRHHSLGAAFEFEKSQYIGTDVGILIQRESLNVTISPVDEKLISEVDCIIDFSTIESSLKLLNIAKKMNKPLVLGTTGFSDQQRLLIESASESIPLLFSPNMSVGVNILFKLTEITSKILKNEFDIEIFEAHHRNKKDAPSGTAKRLLDIIKQSVEELQDASEIYDRSVITEKRTNNEIGISSLRGGDIIGEHTVFFIGNDERLELTHKAASRNTLASGAVFAMEFLVNKPAGLYSMFDVLGL